MSPAISVYRVEPQAFVSVREHCEQREIPGFVQRAFGELFRCLWEMGIAPSGRPFVIYHAFGPDGVDAEVALPVREHLATPEFVKSGALPAMSVARVVHLGPYGAIGQSYAALAAWIEDRGYQPSGPILERYIVGPGDGVPASQFRTEIEMPLVEEAVAAPV